MPKVYLSGLEAGYGEVIRAGLEWVGCLSRIRPGDRVVVKPNLTFPTFRKGVMTNPAAIEQLIVVLKDYTGHITIVEADSGGYNPFPMSQVFSEIGLTDIAARYGVRLVNLSYQPSRDIEVRAGLRRIQVPLPRLVLDDTDLFVTMPVPKIHMNTGVSLSVKNQWGVIQSPAMRLKLHPYFRHVVYAVNKALPRTVAVVDGKYGLTRSGPMRGEVVELNWLLVADDVFGADVACCRLMGIEPRRIGYLKHVMRREGLEPFEAIQWSRDPGPFVRRSFYLVREWTDYPGLLAFKSRMLAYIGYESPLAGPLHKLLYKFREPFY
jgi:uncharacterized protein (DUF362 family)